MQSPRLPSIFKSPKVRSFSFPLRYYDERKERIEKLLVEKREIIIRLFNINKMEAVNVYNS